MRTTRKTALFLIYGVIIIVILLGLSCSDSPTSPTDYSSLKIVPPPNGGMYIGQYEWREGDIAIFEEAIGRKVALFSFYKPMSGIGKPSFDVSKAERAWQEGKVVGVFAYEASPSDEQISGFTVDKLLNGDYDNDLKTLAGQFRQFGKPMFFITAREPNEVLSRYFGGFGTDGDKSLQWAIDNQKGLAEFDPSEFPNAASLYSDLGDPQVSDGVERLIAAQRYYYDFFIRQEGLTFLTFDSMGWADVQWREAASERGVDITDPNSNNYRLMETSFSFKYFYPGDDYVDWVSITFYISDWGGTFNDPIANYLDRLATLMAEIRSVAPNKPFFIMELGFSYDKANPDHELTARKVTASLNEFITKYP